MATRKKTIERIFSVDISSLAAATRRDLTAITLHIPETVVAFRSVVAEVLCYDDATATQNLTSVLIGIKLGAVAFDDVTVTDTITNSGEGQGYTFHRDVTGYFTTNWTGTSMTCQVGLNFGGAVTQNHSVRLLITYEYDDTATTHIKTVRIPVESTLGQLSNTYQALGGSTPLPALTGGYLPEDSITIRQVWLEMRQYTRTGTGTDDHVSTLRVNGVGTYDYFDEEGALQSGRYARSFVDITAEDLSAARSLEVVASATGRQPIRPGATLCVTYEFDPASATILNSLLMGAVDLAGFNTNNQASGDADQWGRDIFIEEPTTITLKESAVVLFGVCDNPTSLQVKVGAQGYTQYANLGSTSATNGGVWSVTHRIDSGGQAAAAFTTLARGRNAYKLSVYNDDASDHWGQLNGYVILNYTSGRATAGPGAHAHSCYHGVEGFAAVNDSRLFAATAPAIPEAAYWLTGVTVYAPGVIDNQPVQAIAILAERKSGEGEGGGWEPAYVGMVAPQNENYHIDLYGAARKIWKRWPADVDVDRLDLETSRRWRVDCPNGFWGQLGIWFTYHAITATKTGTVSGYADADGAGLTVRLYNSVTGEYVGSVVTTTGGAFSFTWYDDTEALFVVCLEDATHVGASWAG